MKTIYKYRQLYGIVKYNIINGKFGDNTLHLQDTTCNHYGPKCEIEVVKYDNDCYQFSKPLNSSAEEYDYFHKGEKFWATKREAYIDAIKIKIKNYQKYIVDNEKQLTDTQDELIGIQSEDVHYLTTATVKLGVNCYVHNEGNCRIIGIIHFEDRTIGYLTNINYTSNWDGDRIILVEDKNNSKIISENGDIVFLSKADSDNYENNNKIANLNKMVKNYQDSIERLTVRLNNLYNAFNKKDILTIDQLIKIINEI